MDSNLRTIIRNRQWVAVASLPRAKVIAFLLIVAVPGGFVVPVCYAVYQAIRASLSK
jgi:hypothetical protein